MPGEAAFAHAAIEWAIPLLNKGCVHQVCLHAITCLREAIPCIAMLLVAENF